MTDRRLIFITGASRSGTTLLSFVLRHHPRVLGLRELQYFGDAWDPRHTGRRLSKAEACEAAARLFDLLHQADGAPQPRIAVAPVPGEGLASAIRDRLKRAAAPRS